MPIVLRFRLKAIKAPAISMMYAKSSHIVKPIQPHLLKITEWIFPMPVLMIATYNEDGSVNVMNAAWGTMQERGTVALNLSENHKTVQNIKGGAPSRSASPTRTTW